MADLTGILRQTFTVPARTIKTIDFKDKQPNYFHIQNIGNDVIYFSVHGMPTASYYDMKIDGGSIGTFTDTYQQPEAFIYNPSTEDVNVIMLSFSAPFDPAVLAQANKQITIGGTIETDGVIKGFQTPLPSGSNKIGSVGISGALPTGSNKIGKVEMTGTEFSNLAAKVSDIRTKLDSLSFDIGAVTVDEVNIKDSGVQGYAGGFQFPAGDSSLDRSAEISAPDGRYFSKIIKIEVCSDSTVTNKDKLNPYMQITPVSGYENIGETLSNKLPLNTWGDNVFNMEVKADKILVGMEHTENITTGTGYSYIILYAETKPYKVTTETLTITDFSQIKKGDKIIKALSGSVVVSNISITYSDFSNGNLTIPGTISVNDGLTVNSMCDRYDGGAITSVTIERKTYSI